MSIKFKLFYQYAVLLLLIATGQLTSIQRVEAQCPVTITFNTQAQIDAFPANFPGCTAIAGYVLIQGQDITNLNGLSQLQSFGDALQITDCPALTNLVGLDNVTTITGGLGLLNVGVSSFAGLNNLTSTAGITVTNCDQLVNITALSGLTTFGNVGVAFQGCALLANLNGLNNITTIGGRLFLDNNTLLNNLSALNNLTQVGGELLIQRNSSLQNLNGLGALQSVGTFLRISLNDMLSSLNGLGALQSVGTNVSITSNAVLSSVSALLNLTQMNGALTVTSNPQLTTLVGLDNINEQTITNLFLSGNQLSVCHVNSVCDYLAIQPPKPRSISGVTTCLNPTAVINACSPVVEIFLSGVSISCESGSFILNLTVNNLNGPALQVLNLSNIGFVLPSGGFIVLGLPIATGEVRQLSYPIFSGVSSGYELCNFPASAVSTTGQTLPLLVNVGTPCPVAPPCDPCSLVNFVNTPVFEAGDKLCCHNINIDNGLDNNWTTNSFLVKSQDGNLFNTTLNPAYSVDWGIFPPTGSATEFMVIHTGIGPIPNGSTDNLIQICKENFSGVQGIRIEWAVNSTQTPASVIQCAANLTLEYNCPTVPPDTCTYIQVNSGVNLPVGGIATFGPPPNNGYINRTLSPPLDNTWTADFEFEITGIDSSGGQVYPFAAVNGTAATHSTNSIGVVVYKPNANYPLTIAPHLIYNSSTYIYVNCPLNILPNVKYRVRLSRLDATNGKFELFALGSGELLGDCCFEIPEGLSGLNTLQVADFVPVNSNFWLKGNTTTFCALSEPSVFCNGGPDCITIVNDSLYCDNGLVKVLYTIKNNSATTIQSVAIDPIGSITAVPAFIPVTILPGATVTLPQSFDLVGSDVIPGQSFCYTFQAYNAPNGQNGLLSCIDSIADNCKIIPLCSDCDSLSASITTIASNNPDSCRLSVGMYIGENVSGVSSGIANIQIVTSQPINLLNTNPDWNFVPSIINPNLIDGYFQGGFPGFPTAGTYNLFEFVVPQGTSTTITVRWLDIFNTVICNKTVLAVCPPDSSDCNYTVTPGGASEINATSNPITFNNVNGNGPDERAWHNIGLQGNNWKAEFDLNITNIDADGGAIVPFAMTAGNSPFTCYPTLCSVDALGVQVWTPPSQQSPIWIAPYVKNNFKYIPYTCAIEINQNQNYTIRLERISATQGKLTVIAASGVVDECCFDIPEGITGLNTSQVSNLQTAWAARQISGTVGKVCSVMPSTANCNMEPPPCVVIVKDSIYCEGNNVKVALTVQNNGNTAIQSIELDPGTATVMPTFLNVTIPAGQTVTTPPFMLSGSGVVAGQDICYTINVYSGPNGQQKLICNDSIVDNCLAIPPCIDCDSVKVLTQVFHTLPNPDPCCWFVHLQNDALPGTVHSVVFETANGSALNFTPHQLLGQGFLSTVNSSTPNLAVLTFTGGAFPSGFIPQLYTHCVASGQSETIYLFWRNESGDVICIDTLQFTCPFQPAPCNQLNIEPVKVTQVDGCCYDLAMTNNASGANFSAILFETDDQSNINWTTGGAAVVTPIGSLPNANSVLQLTNGAPGTGFIPTGTANIVRFCLNPGQLPTKYYVSWVQVLNGQNLIVCQDSFILECPVPPINCDSIEIAVISPTVQGQDPCSFGLEITNNNPAGVITGMSISSSMPINVTGTDWGLTPTSGLQTLLTSSGPIPNSTDIPLSFELPAGQNTTLTIQFTAADGTICSKIVQVQCKPLFNCDSIAVSYQSLQQNSDSCCYRISIENNNAAGVVNNFSVGMFSDQVINVSNIASNWIVFPLGIAPTGKEFLIQHGSGTFPTGQFDVFDVCIAAGVNQTIVFNLGPDCVDSLVLECTVPPCDTNCYVNPQLGLNLNTGYQEEIGAVIPAVGIDNDWTLISAPDPGLLLPMPAFVIGQQSAAWATFPNSNWISAYPYSLQNTANLPPQTPYIFERCFDICDSSTLTITASAHADNDLVLNLRDAANNLVGNVLNIPFSSGIAAFTNPPTTGTLNVTAAAGEYCLEAELRNTDAQSRMGFNLTASVKGEHLVQDSCKTNPANAIVGEKYWDKNCNGQRDNILIEPGLAGWVIELRDPITNNVIATTMTNSNGTWAFVNITPGTYVINEVQQASWVQTEPNSPTTYTVTIGSFNGLGIYRFGNCSDITPPCDYDVVLDPVASPNDTCCWAVDIVNNVTNPNVLIKVQFSSSNGKPFSVMGLNPAFNVVQIDPQNVQITPVGGGLFPTGLLNDVFKICIAEANSPVTIDVFYEKSGNLFCKDSLSLSCPIPLCPIFSNSALNCTDGQLEYCFTVTNPSSNPISVPVVLSAPNATFTPTQVLVAVPANGTANFCVDLSGTPPAEGDTLCIEHLRINANSTTTACFDTCLVVPPCDLCPIFSNSALNCTDGQLEYCFTVTNPSSNPISVPVVLSAPNATFTPTQVLVAVPANGTASFCVDISGTPPAEGDTLCITHLRINANSMTTACFDTCLVVPPCDLSPIFSNSALNCTDGQLEYCFTVTNPSSTPISVPVVLSAPNATFTPTQVLVAVPANGTSNFCVDLTGTPPAEGNTLCITHLQINADSTTTACFDTCLVVPPCATSDGCVYILGDDLECVDGAVQYRFYLKNGTNQPIRSIVLIPQNSSIEVVPDEIVLPGTGLLPGQTGGPYTLDLIGAVTPGALFCYVVEVRDQAQNNNPTFVHRDTISAGCRVIPACPQTLCLTPTANVLSCEPVGRLYYDFTVSNPSSSVSLTEIYFHFPNSNDTSKFFVDPIVLSPALAPGQSRTLRVEVFKWGNFKLGDNMCFGVIGTNTLGIAPANPVACDTICLALPLCACEEVCYECCTNDDLQLPTGLSPNGDNLNDVYIVNSGTKVCPVELRVYNRWGNLVWKEDNTYTNNWGGTNQAGETLPEGTYYVLVRIKATGQTLANFVDLKRQ